MTYPAAQLGAEIVSAWEEAAREQPWLVRRWSESDPAAGGPPSVLHDLLADLDGGPEELRRPRVEALVGSAAAHARRRRLQGASQDTLLFELVLLRHAIWRVLRRRRGEGADVLLRIDRRITTAVLATLRGYHRDELKAAGQWPAALRQVIDEALAADL